MEAEYNLPKVSAKLNLTYVINNVGAMRITQKLTTEKSVKVPNMFRFGMQLPMPRRLETIE